MYYSLISPDNKQQSNFVFAHPLPEDSLDEVATLMQEELEGAGILSPIGVTTSHFTLEVNSSNERAIDVGTVLVCLAEQQDYASRVRALNLVHDLAARVVMASELVVQ